MTDITTIPLEELEKDLLESNIDLAYAQVAKSIGITEYGNGQKVQRRIDGNIHVIEVINKELARRQNEYSN